MSTIKVICAWCGAEMGDKDGQGKDGVSHGMCPACYDEFVAEAVEGQDPEEVS